jgi:hypothetical protein
MANDGFAQITLTPILLARRAAAPPAQSDAVAFSRLGDNHLRRVGPTLAANFYSIQMERFKNAAFAVIHSKQTPASISTQYKWTISPNSCRPARPGIPC